MEPAVRTVVWRGLTAPSMEYFRLWEGSEPRLQGTVVLAGDAAPCGIRYEIACTEDWETRAVEITLERDAATHHLTLAVDDRGRWWVDGRPLDEVDSCRDVDLAWSPSTNTLPIRRLGLAVGEARDVVAAWVRLPGLIVTPLPQRYTRLSADRYRYESSGGRFVAELQVDDLGLVTRYPPGWERVG